MKREGKGKEIVVPTSKMFSTKIEKKRGESGEKSGKRNTPDLVKSYFYLRIFISFHKYIFSPTFYTIKQD